MTEGRPGGPAGPRGPRRWAACEGSGIKPWEVRADRGVIVGRCPICQRWISVTKRTEVIRAHRFLPRAEDAE